MKNLTKPNILALARKTIKSRRMCSNCLGRQFARISTGMTNKKRGEIIRKFIKEKEPGSCEICKDLFKHIDKYAAKAVKKLKGLEFSTFWVGSILNNELIRKEEELWEEIGIEYCEPLKSEFNRELGKAIYTKIKKEADEKPDVLILADLPSDDINIRISSLFVYGKYKKLIRGIPQTKWDKYKVTVEDIIARPFMAAMRGAGHALHASGREDIDARCLDWRPFVFEITCPKKRKINFKKIQSAINKTKKVEVSGLRYSDKKEVVKIKAARQDKEYRALVELERPVLEKDIRNLKKLIGVIKQKTPERVMHRRANKTRNRKVINIEWKKINNKKLELKIRGEAGLYIKELVTGDNGRTEPSVSETLNTKARVKELDVIKIHLNN